MSKLHFECVQIHTLYYSKTFCFKRLRIVSGSELGSCGQSWSGDGVWIGLCFCRNHFYLQIQKFRQKIEVCNCHKTIDSFPPKIAFRTVKELHHDYITPITSHKRRDFEERLMISVDRCNQESAWNSNANYWLLIRSVGLERRTKLELQLELDMAVCRL